MANPQGPQGQDRRHGVSPEEYKDAEPWRAVAIDIIAPFLDIERDQERGRFTLRLLDPEGNGAFDRFVEVTDVEFTYTRPVPTGTKFVAVVQQVLNGVVITKRTEYHPVSAECMVLDETGLDQGYFLGGENMGEDEFGSEFTQALVFREAPRQEGANQQYASGEPAADPDWPRQHGSGSK